MNNDAVDKIIAGEYQTAVRQLSSALSAFKHIMNRAASKPSNGQCANILPGDAPISLDYCMRRQEMTGRAVRRCSRAEKDLDLHSMNANEQYFIYQDPVRIPEQLAADTSDRASISISSLIVFNLALAIQLLAQSSGRNPAMFSKAVKLYELAFAMAQNELNNSGSNPLYVMAVVNNMGVIYLMINDFPNAQKCFQVVMSTLMFLVEYEMQHSIVDFDRFLDNATSSIVAANVPPIAWAPAA